MQFLKQSKFSICDTAMLLLSTLKNDNLKKFWYICRFLALELRAFALPASYVVLTLTLFMDARFM